MLPARVSQFGDLVRSVRPLLLSVILIAPIGAAHAQSSYFADGSRCEEVTARKERVQVITGGAATFVDIYLGPDPAAFAACMQAAGHPPPRFDAEQYTTIARTCLAEARAATDRDAAYAECLRRSGIVVEALPADEKK
jgi:hypothetical protein